MKYEKPFKAYKFFFIILSLYKQFICKRQVTQCGAYLRAALKTIVSAAAHIKSPPPGPNAALI